MNCYSSVQPNIYIGSRREKGNQNWPTSGELWFVMSLGGDVLGTGTDLGKVDTYFRHIFDWILNNWELLKRLEMNSQ